MECPAQTGAAWKARDGLAAAILIIVLTFLINAAGNTILARDSSPEDWAYSHARLITLMAMLVQNALFISVAVLFSRARCFRSFTSTIGLREPLGASSLAFGCLAVVIGLVALY